MAKPCGGLARNRGARGCGIAFGLLLALGPYATASPRGYLSAEPAWTASSGQDYSAYGHALAGLGDVNGDGFADLAVGAAAFDAPELTEGRVFVYCGSATGLSAEPCWTAESNLAGAGFGRAVGAAGDVNGDGFADLLVGAPEADAPIGDRVGRAYLYLGSAAGLAAAPAWTVEGTEAMAGFGHAVAGAGDVDGDGYGDVLIGAPNAGLDVGRPSAGRVFLYLGAPAGQAETAAWIHTGPSDFGFLGWAVAGAGDVNADGFADLLLGAPGEDVVYSNDGAARVFLGGPSLPGHTPAWLASGATWDASCGAAVAAAGDVNGDGFADVLVGAPYDDSAGAYWGGRATLYLGAPYGVEPVDAWQYTLAENEAHVGMALAGVGDVDGDGLDDVLVGAPGRTGDVWQEGEAALFLGLASGSLTATPVWSARSGHFEAFFGAALGGLGDVDGDGRVDVAVGAEGYDDPATDGGTAFAYYGEAPEPLGELGAPCGAGAECASGFCVDAVCCAVASCADGDRCTADSCAPTGQCSYEALLHDGDVDQNAAWTAGDASLAFSFALGLPAAPENDAFWCAADCNGDGRVTAGDAQRIFATAFGLDRCVDAP